MSQKKTHRYPGVQPFQKEQAHLFFGRDEDTERLFDLILLEKLVVLFGKSGYGKSSLLNAGILPLLDKETAKGKRQYLPVQVRFNAYTGNNESLIGRFAFHFLMDLAPESTNHITFPDEQYPYSLWYIHKFARLGPDTTILLIFDQFEEFFTYPEAQQQEFKRQLAELLYADVPTYVKQNEDKHTPEEIAFLREKMDVKTIFSIRADRMSDLDRLKDKLPAILHKRCELRALSTTQAREALVEPARKAGDFLSPAFDWTDKALARILDEFSHDKQGREVGVEAFLLQVLAQNVESQLIRGDIADRDGNGTPDVSPEDLPDDLSNIFAEYYQNKINELPAASRLPARLLIEDGLVFATGEGDARRLSMDADVLMQQSGADKDLLKALEDTFLLRREVNTTGGWNYELSHDTLLKPVLDWREERRGEEQRELDRLEAEKAVLRARELEAQAAEERRRAEEAERLKVEAEKGRKWARLLGFFAGLVAIIAIGLGFFAVEKQRQQEKQSIRTYANDLAFKSLIALRDGDRTTAFRIAEFAQRYVDGDNLKVINALMQTLYQSQQPLPWASNLEGHTDGVCSVAFSPNGKLVATGSGDEKIKIWDLSTGKSLLTLEGDSSLIRSVAFTPDGSRLATGSENGYIKIWDLSTGKPIMMFGDGTAGVLSVTISPDGSRLATGLEDKMVIWDMKSGRVVLRLENDSNEFLSVAFSPDGSRLAISWRDNKTKIWDLSTSKSLLTLQGDDIVTSVSFSPDGSRLATGSGTTTRIWDLATGKTTQTLKGHSNEVTSVAFSPDGSHLATGSLDHTAKIWDAFTGKDIVTLKGHTDYVNSVAFSPDGLRLATASDDKTAKIWDLTILSLPGQLSQGVPTLEGHLEKVSCLTYSPDGRHLATGSFDKTVKIWDLTNKKNKMTLEGHTSHVWNASFSPDGSRLATFSFDKTVKIWDWVNGKVTLSLEGNSSNILSIAFSFDGLRLATGADNGIVKIWDLTTSKVIQTKKLGTIRGLAFSPDGNNLAICSKSGISNLVKIWDLSSGRVTTKLKDYGESNGSLDFSSDCKYLAVGLGNNNAQIWDLSSGSVVIEINGHKRPIRGIDFSPDGRWLATGSEDKTVKIWDLATGKSEVTLQGHRNAVRSVAFSPDGFRLATGSEDNTAKVWELTSNGWMETGGLEKRLAGLIQSQLTEYGLENLLDIRSDNEAILLSSGDTWQISAFAGLYADRISKSIPKKEDYERAKRLYQACIASGVDSEYFEQRLAYLEQAWRIRARRWR
jgi:WD40 repeat protein